MPQSNEFKRCRYWLLDQRGVCVQCAKARDTANKMCSKCLTRSKAASGRWKAKQDRYERKKALLRKYGLTLAQWDALIVEQHGRCALCGTDTPVRGGWQVDHCHGTGRVRGLLCRLCNVGLGSFKDDPALLERAAEYVRKHKVTLVG